MSAKFRGTIAAAVERWTRGRRVEHTRSLLVDAAEAVFAEKGFTPATLGARELGARELDDADRYRAALEMYVSVVKPP